MLKQFWLPLYEMLASLELEVLKVDEGLAGPRSAKPSCLSAICVKSCPSLSAQALAK